MKKKIAIIMFVLLTSFSVVPAVGYTQQLGPTTLNYSGLVQCDGVISPNEQDRQRVCNFAALMSMANSIINWLFMISIPVIIGLCAYSGYLFMIGTSEKREKAKKILWNAVIGFIFMLCAWFIVSTLLKWLVKDTFTGANTLIQQQK